ncbi:MAG: HAMP domain-containing sensor histidine kinase [Anaerolineales bacterium]
MSLRRQLLLSHILPLVFSIPLIGLLLISAIEDRVIIPNLTAQVEESGRLISRLLSDSPGTWEDSASAQTFIDRYAFDTPWRLMLLDNQGHVLASNREADRSRIGELTTSMPQVNAVLAGEASMHVDYSLSLEMRVIDYWAPVHDGERVQGIMRISQPLSNALDTFIRLRTTVIAILFGGLALGAFIGFGLASAIGRPLHKLADAMSLMSSGKDPDVVETTGPEEFQLLAQSFNALIERLQHQAAVRKKLLANLVHELSRPLGALRSAIQALSGGADRNLELKAELLAGMDLQTHILERLIDDLTQLSDRERSTLELERVPTDLSQWFLSSTQTWEAQAQEKGINWSMTAGPLPVHEIDPLRLGQAWGNLLSNAIRFTPPGGQITLSAELGDDEVRLSVTDNGIGLSPEDQEMVFEPFFRSNHDQRFPKGMGLGLSIAEELVRAHQGYIEFQSELGKGSTFTICLPLHPSRSSPLPA